jgi:hypothetical protein
MAFIGLALIWTGIIALIVCTFGFLWPIWLVLLGLWIMSICE